MDGERFSYEKLMMWILLILLIPLLAYIFIPEAFVGLGISLTEKYRNYIGKKKLKIAKDFLYKKYEKKAYATKALDEFFSIYSDELIETEGNIELGELLENTSPFIRDRFSQNRLWTYKLNRLLTKHLYKKYKLEEYAPL